MQITKKTIAIILAIALLATQSAVLLAPKQASAQSTVPVDVEKDKTSVLHELVRGAIIAAMNSAFNELNSRFNNLLEDTFGVESYLKYQQALVDAKYIMDAYSQGFGEDAVSGEGENGNRVRKSDIGQLVFDFASLPLNQNLTRDAATKIAINELSAQSPEERKKNIQRMIVGASSLFISSVACDSVDNRAVRNASAYLAAASSGIDKSSINSRDGIRYYEQMARLGAPTSNPDFWTIALRDVAAQTEARAKQSAALELTSPGLKSPQIRNAAGQLQTGRSLNLVSAGQENSQAALFNLKIFGSTQSVYDTSSLDAFMSSVIRREVGGLVSGLVNNFLSGLDFGILGGGAADITNAVSEFAGAAATNMVTSFAEGLYNDVAGSIFRGEVLAESNGCGGRASLSSAVYEPNQSNTSVASARVQFDVSPSTITRGEVVYISWNAIELGDDLTVEIEGGNISGVKDLIGDESDTPLEDTTYKLTITGPDISPIVMERSVSVTGDLSFTAEPSSVEAGREVRLIWDAEDLSDEIILIPLYQDGFGHEPAGNVCYSPEETIRFQFLAPDPTGNNVVQIDRDVSVVSPAPRSVNFNDNSTGITWNITGYPDTTVKINGQTVGKNGSMAVNPSVDTTYTLTVEEANGCGVLYSESIDVSGNGDGSVAGVSISSEKAKLKPRQ